MVHVEYLGYLLIIGASSALCLNTGIRRLWYPLNSDQVNECVCVCVEFVFNQQPDKWNGGLNKAVTCKCDRTFYFVS